MNSTEKLEQLAGFDTIGLRITRIEDGVFWIGDRKAKASELTKAGFAAARRSKRDAINRQREAVVAAGFHHNFGGDIGTRTFDQRGPADDVAWLGLKSLADDLVAMGEGETMLAIRDAANQTFEAPASAIVEALRTMGAWRALVWKRSWDLKTEAEGAADQAALDAIDIIAGWP